MPRVALALYVAFAAVTFGWRTWLQYRWTGDPGFRGLTGRAGSLEWWGGILVVFGSVLGAAAPATEIGGAIEPLRLPYQSLLNAAGLAAALSGFAMTFAAQLQMRASWRIGVDDRERTPLVTAGLFAVVRNPIFSGMLLVLAGVLLMAPNLLSAVALAATLAGVEIQVRRVEEPYLLRTHGEGYRAYARRVGRFAPWLGML